MSGKYLEIPRDLKSRELQLQNIAKSLRLKFYIDLAALNILYTF